MGDSNKKGGFGNIFSATDQAHDPEPLAAPNSGFLQLKIVMIVA